VYEADDAPGGQLRLAAFVPGREEFAKIQEHLLAEASRTGVTIHAREAVDATRSRPGSTLANTVVLATVQTNGRLARNGAGLLTLEAALRAKRGPEGMSSLSTRSTMTNYAPTRSAASRVKEPAPFRASRRWL